jgi:diguanylate cyclase (GGDEF)-like protein
MLGCYCVAMGALAAMGIAFPGSAPAGSAVAGLLGAVGLLLGAQWYGSHRPGPWRLLALTVVVCAAGDLLADLAAGRAWSLAAATAMSLAAVVPMAAALSGLARSGNATRDRTGVVESVVATLAVLLVAWVGAASPYVPGPAHRTQVMLWPLADVLALAIVVRMLWPRRRVGPATLLAAGATGALVADAIHALSLVDAIGVGGPVATAVITVGRVTCYAAWGVAALRPSMARLGDTELLVDRRISKRRSIQLAATSLLGPAILVAESLTGDVRDGVAVAVASSLIILLNLGSVTETANAHGRSLTHREYHDSLTGLANRTRFASRLADAAARSRAGGPGAGVIVIDLDDFKMVNESIGQLVGDEVLVAVARRLVRIVGRHDLAARLGGDEFAILLEAPGSPLQVEEFAARVSAALAEPMTFAGKTIDVTASIGATFIGGGVPDPLDGDPLSQAGLAQRAARTTGRSQWQRYRADQHGPIVERMRLRTALSRAVTDGAFALRYQPILTLDGAETVGFEALVRWEHPQRGLVGPAEFIQLAEETDLIEPIGHLVLRRAVTAAAHWHRAAPPGPYVSVNVSAHQLRRPGFAEMVDRELTTAGLPPANLMLELTESVLLREDDTAWAELAALRDTGVRMAIDDFGTGSSSLSYLLQTPIDVIKIDRSFIASLSASRERAIVDGIVRLADNLGLRVVAEGIETAADRDLLAEMGCPYGQGFLYSAPLTSADAVRWAVGLEPLLGSEHPTKDEYAHSGARPAWDRTLPS